MTVFRAEFRWALPVSNDTVQRYADLIAVRSGFPCRCTISSAGPSYVEASLTFPRVSSSNFVTVSTTGGDLEFAPIPFFWLHALACVRELGGTVHSAIPPNTHGQTAPPWQRLKWSDRARLLLGRGPWVRFG